MTCKACSYQDTGWSDPNKVDQSTGLCFPCRMYVRPGYLYQNAAGRIYQLLALFHDVEADLHKVMVFDVEQEKLVAYSTRDWVQKDAQGYYVVKRIGRVAVGPIDLMQI